MPPFRVAIAGKQQLFLQSIRKNIDKIPDLKIVGEVSLDPELFELLTKFTVDLIIMDVANLREMEKAKTIKAIYPAVKILILTVEKSKEFVLQAILAGVDGCMLTENTYSDLITAIHKIRQGGSYFCSIISSKMADIIREQLSGKIVQEPLTIREIGVLKLRCEGNSFNKIAELLSLSPRTVGYHLGNIKKKLHIRDKSELMEYAIKQGYFP